MNPDTNIKIVFVGESNAGKTCLCVRYIENSYGETHGTVGASFYRKKVCWNNEQLTIGVWDTAGQERFGVLASFYARNANYAILCFDLTDKETWKGLDKWKKIIPEKTFVLLVGCKYDLVEGGKAARCVSESQVLKYLKKIPNSIGYIETSSKSNYNIREAFQKIENHYTENHEIFQDVEDKSRIRIHPRKNTEQTSQSCCNKS